MKISGKVLSRTVGNLVFKRMKKWTRAGIYEELDKVIESKSASGSLLVVGGYGPVLNHITSHYSHFNITTLDIDKHHQPDLLFDLSDSTVTNEIETVFDIVVLVEVLEHIHNYSRALENVNALLRHGGIIFGSTPWLMPIHDAPRDFLRFSHYELSHSLAEAGFSNYKILGRGDMFDSLLILGFRGLMEKSLGSKVLAVLAYVLSFCKKQPRLHYPPTGFTFGYVFHARKA